MYEHKEKKVIYHTKITKQQKESFFIQKNYDGYYSAMPKELEIWFIQ